MQTLIIIPTYNEVENLPSLLEGIFTYAPETEVLVVDDNSPDGTGDYVEELGNHNPRVHLMRRPGKLGLGTAYIAGFKFAIAHGYDAAFEMDADFSHDPRHLPDFLYAIQRADLIIGSRYIPGGCTPNWSLVRRMISGSGNIFARFMLNVPVHDCTGGYRCYRREVLEAIDLDSIQSRGYAFQVEMTYRVLTHGFKIVETPITFMDRRLGQSKMSKKIIIEAFTYVLQTRFRRPPLAHPATSTLYAHQVINSADRALPYPEKDVQEVTTPIPQPQERLTTGSRMHKQQPVRPFDAAHPRTPADVNIAAGQHQEQSQKA